MDLDELFQEPMVIDYRNQLLTVNQEALWEKYHDLNRFVKPNSILFVGDSITEFNPIDELISSTLPVYNRGIRGLTSLQLLNHINDQIVDVQARFIFLMIGVNDLKTRTPKETFRTILEIIKKVKKDCPNSTLFLQAVLPINESHKFKRSNTGRSNHSICQLNQLLKTIDGVIWLDFHDILCDNHKQLAHDYTVDGVHLTVSAYHLLAQKLQDMINEVVS